MNRERESDRGVRKDGRTCIDLHVKDITYFRITHSTTEALLEVQHTTRGCLKYDLRHFGFSQRWLWRCKRVLGRDETSCCAGVNTDVSDAPASFIPNWSSWFLRCQYTYTTVHGVTWQKMLSLWVRIYILLLIRKVHRRSPCFVVLISWSQIPWDLVYPRRRIVSCFANNACRPLFSGESPEVGVRPCPLLSLPVFHCCDQVWW